MSRWRPEIVRAWGLSMLILTGCASQEIKVSCDGKLQPINPPGATASHPRDGGKPVSVAQTVGDKTR